VVAHGQLEEEAGIEAAACSGAGDEVAACFRARIEDDRWWRWRDDF
jgi:hypothetical protein